MFTRSCANLEMNRVARTWRSCVLQSKDGSEPFSIIACIEDVPFAKPHVLSATTLFVSERCMLCFGLDGGI